MSSCSLCDTKEDEKLFHYHRPQTENLPVMSDDEIEFDWDFMAELLQDLLDDAPAQVQSMTQACESNDHKTFYEVAHGIKGAALNLHLIRLSTVAKYAEQCGKHLNLHFVDKKHFASTTVRGWLEARALCLTALTREFATIKEFLAELEQGGDSDYSDEDDEDDDEGYY